MKSVCSKAKCKTSDGKKPTMILRAWSKQQTAKRVLYESDLSELRLFIWKVQGRQNLAVEVQCLEHPFGVRHHQNMEKDSVHYNEVFLCEDCKPKLEKVGRKWKLTY